MTDYAHHFSINNIPFGIASNEAHPNKAVATRFENTVIFLDELAKHHASELEPETIAIFSKPVLNPFIDLSTKQHDLTRTWLQTLLSTPSSLHSSATSPISTTTLHLPLSIGDFTDFSCSLTHVLNASQAVTGTASIPPGFEHFPVGYHGRCSSIVVSGTDVVRPKGQFKNEEGEVVFGESRRMDYELEVGAVIRRGREVEAGEGVRLGDIEKEGWIFGVVLVNDWSARDIQALEMPPLGPLSGKSFLTSISPWIITLAALEPFRTPPPARNSAITLPEYLQDPSPTPSYNISLTATLTPSTSTSGKGTVVTESNLSDMYWTLRDLVAHQTANGCSLRTGDLLATGTVSGKGEKGSGCLLEYVRKGGVEVEGVGKRVWLEDGDEVEISGVAGDGVGFGGCVGKLVAARK